MRQRIYPPVLMVFCFFIGLIAGTIWVNLMAEDLQGQLGTFGLAGLLKSTGGAPPSLAQVIPVLVSREMAAGFLWLVGMTVFALPGLSMAAVYGGFSMAAVIALMTVEAGLLGLPIYLLSVFPQVLFYTPVIAVLFFWGLEPVKKAHMAGFIVLLFTVALGTIAETCISPYVLGLINLIT